MKHQEYQHIYKFPHISWFWMHIPNDVPYASFVIKTRPKWSCKMLYAYFAHITCCEIIIIINWTLTHLHTYLFVGFFFEASVRSLFTHLIYLLVEYGFLKAQTCEIKTKTAHKKSKKKCRARITIVVAAIGCNDVITLSKVEHPVFAESMRLFMRMCRYVYVCVCRYHFIFHV